MASNRRRPRPGADEKRDQLLSAAITLFAVHGYSDTSVQQIAEAANVSKGFLYHYYGSKDDLLFGIYEPLLAMQRRRLDEHLALDLPVRERVLGAARDVLRTSMDNIKAFTVFFQSVHLLGADNRARVRAARREYHDRFRAVLVEGQKSGAFRTDISADLMVHSFFGSVHHMCYWYHPDAALPAEEIADALALLFLEGVDQP